MAKTDPFSIADGTILKIDEVADNASANVAEALDETGSFVAHSVYGERLAPSATYRTCSDGNVTGVKLGAVTTYKSKRVVLTSVSVNTSAGGNTEVSASGEEVETATSGTCPMVFALPSLAVGVCTRPRVLDSAFTLGGTGCHLQTASYTFSCSNSPAEVDGEVVAHGVHSGVAECQVEIVQTDTAEPTLTAGDGWFISSPLSKSHSGAEYPTWSATLRKHLTGTVPSSNS